MNSRRRLTRYSIAALIFAWGMAGLISSPAKAQRAIISNAVNGLNLSAYPELQANLLDCQLRLEGKAPNYKLIYSKGTISIPQGWISFDKRMKPYAKIMVVGKFHTLSVTEIRVPYQFDDFMDFPKIWGTFDTTSGTKAEGNKPYFAFRESPETVSKVISRLLLRNFVLEPRQKGPYFDPTNLVFTSEGTYPLLEIMPNHQGALLEYMCVLP